MSNVDYVFENTYASTSEVYHGPEAALTPTEADDREIASVRAQPNKGRRKNTKSNWEQVT